MTTSVHELAEHLRQHGIEVRGVVSRTRQRMGKTGEVGDIELAGDFDVEVDEEGTMLLSWWMPDDRQRAPIGEFTPAQLPDLLQTIKDYRPLGSA
jgi:hypothetical protein